MTILYALTCIKCACSRTINCFKFILLCVSCYHQCICIFKGDCSKKHVQLQLYICIFTIHSYYTIMLTLIYVCMLAHSLLDFVVGSHLYTYYTCYAIKQSPCILLDVCVVIMKEEL